MLVVNIQTTLMCASEMFFRFNKCHHLIDFGKGVKLGCRALES